MNNIHQRAKQQMMDISQKKTKAMIFNFTQNSQFTTRLNLKGENIEMVKKMKLLGIIINDKLTWDDNCAFLIKKVNSRMQLLRNLQSFGASQKEMVHFWTIFCRSVIEQSSVLWNSSLSQENIEDLERTIKTFAKLVLQNDYTSYQNAIF